MVQAVPSRTRVDQSVRWHRAAERAQAEGIQVRQLQGSGAWIATSGTQRGVAYELRVTGNVAHGCDCLAGLNSDLVCKHRAAFYLLIGALDLSPEPDPPAPVLTCPECSGGGVIYVRDCARSGWPFPRCEACAGTGVQRAPSPPRSQPDAPAALAA
jgi:hypothetical protein